MKTLYLITVIFFNTLGEPVILDGWHPLEVSTMERCEEGAENVREYIDMLMRDGGLPDHTRFEVTCDIMQSQEIKIS